MTDELDDALQALDAKDISPVYLVWGEEFLVRQAAEQLLAKLLPQGARDFGCVTLDGASPKEVAAELDTLPMFGGRKVVFLRDPEFLAPKKGRADALSRVRDAWKANRKKEAARRLLALAARAGWGVQDLDPSSPGAPAADEWERELGVTLADADVAFLGEVAAFCRAEGLAAPAGDDAALSTWLQKQPPDTQVLLIATTELEAKHPFVKLVKDNASFIERKVTSKLKDLDLTDFAAQTLAPHKKKLGPGALTKLKDRVGGNFRLLHSELEKLALHSDGATISVKDVELLVGHAREEEYMELADALQKRSFEAAQKYLEDALAQGAAPLALLGAITSVVRNLLLAAERLTRLADGRPPRSFDDFKARVWPRIEAEAEAKKARLGHPYAAFMSMQSAGAYGRATLLRALCACAEADLALKRSGTTLVLERLLWTLSGKAPPGELPMHSLRTE